MTAEPRKPEAPALDLSPSALRHEAEQLRGHASNYRPDDPEAEPYRELADLLEAIAARDEARRAAVCICPRIAEVHDCPLHGEIAEPPAEPSAETGARHECFLCSRWFATREDLEAHDRTAHPPAHCYDASCTLGEGHSGEHFDAKDGKRWPNYMAEPSAQGGTIRSAERPTLRGILLSAGLDNTHDLFWRLVDVLDAERADGGR